MLAPPGRHAARIVTPDFTVPIPAKRFCSSTAFLGLLQMRGERRGPCRSLSRCILHLFDRGSPLQDLGNPFVGGITRTWDGCRVPGHMLVFLNGVISSRGRRVRYLIAALTLAGAIVSALALHVHYSSDTAPCSINEHWDCGVVNRSPFAEIEHVPVAAIGIGGYLLLGGLALARWRFPLFLCTTIALGFALRLTFLEEYVLQVWCLYCVISQVLIGVITLLSLGWFLAEYLGLKRAARSA
jgi:vitamin-K-epoxide reductase (warfarin-sensitive)